jgi:acyl-coenzyme A synthetase/AMP-(fatty) acid ligase
VVCVKPEASATEKELRGEPLPKTPVGKIKRKELRELFWIGQERRIAGN